MMLIRLPKDDGCTDGVYVDPTAVVLVESDRPGINSWVHLRGGHRVYVAGRPTEVLRRLGLRVGNVGESDDGQSR